MNLFRILFGTMLLALGRRLYWLFVAGFGFLLGLRLAGSILPNSPQWFRLLLAFSAGLVGAVIAVTLQRFGIGLAGFLAGAYIAFSLLERLNADPTGWFWILYLVGGIIGAIMLMAIFEWALIILSTLGGSMLVIQGLEVGSPWSIMLFVTLFIAGIALQARVFKR